MVDADLIQWEHGFNQCDFFLWHFPKRGHLVYLLDCGNISFSASMEDSSDLTASDLCQLNRQQFMMLIASIKRQDERKPLGHFLKPDRSNQS